MLKYPEFITKDAAVIPQQDPISDVLVSAQPMERKDPPPKKPPIKSPKKPGNPIGDPPSKKPRKRVGLGGILSKALPAH